MVAWVVLLLKTCILFRLDHHDAIVVENGEIVYIGSNAGALAYEQSNTL